MAVLKKGRVEDFDGFLGFFFSLKFSKSSSPGWNVGLGSLRSCSPAGMTKPPFRWTLRMELELQEAPERFYFTKKEKKGYLEEKKPNKPPLCRAGVGYWGLGWLESAPPPPRLGFSTSIM